MIDSIPEQHDYNDDDKSEGEANIPPFLGRVLDILREKRVDESELYNDFLIYANQAQENSVLQKFPIEASYKLIGSIPPETAMNQENKNDTLLLIFDFYARIRQSNSNKTFSETLMSFQTMNFSKMEVFCRDFQIIPKLLTREDLKVLWEEIGREHVLKGLGVFTVVDFQEFKDLIIRMALWSYYKPGLKKLVLTVEGFLPKPVEIVQYFCTFLHLYDDDYIHHHLRTVGRKTQADYNYRSKDEMNMRTKLEVRVDTNARSMKQVSRKTPSSSTATKSSANSSSRVNAFGEKVKNKVEIRAANPRDVIGNSSKSTFQTREGSLTSPLKVKVQLPPALVDRFEALRANDQRITPYSLAANDGEAFEQPPLPPVDAKKPTVTIQSQPKRLGTGLGSSFRGNYGNDEPDDDDDSVDSFAHTSSLDSAHHGAQLHDNSLEALRETYQAHYDPRLVNELLQYCYVPPRTVVVDWIPTHGALVDLGLLEGGMKVTINYRVVNNTGDDVYVDFTTKDFQSDDTDVKTLTKPLIPGMSRVVTVTFTVPERKITVLGFFEVYLVDLRHSMKGLIRCPVFYYVDPGLDRPLFPSCNGKALPDLLLQRLYCTNTPADVNSRRVHTSFQTRRALDGSWKHSLKGMDFTRRPGSGLFPSSRGNTRELSAPQSRQDKRQDSR